MTERENPKPPADMPAVEVLRERLRDRGVETLACPACGADAWGGVVDVGVPILKPVDPETGQPTGFKGSVHALLGVCGRCGFLAMFDRDVIGR